MIKSFFCKAFLFFFITATNLVASDCGAPGLNPICSIDWDYFMDNTELEFKSCTCDTAGNDMATKAGFMMSIVEPIAMIDATSTPWSFPTFDMSFDDSPSRKQGNSHASKSSSGDSGAFRYTHFVIYPVFAMLNYTQDYVCFERFSEMNLAFLGEIRPDHNNDIIAAFLKPASLLFGNPVAQLACGLDCAASTFNSPMNTLPWCAGCWGNIATGTGYTSGRNPVTEAALLATRLLDTMHYSYALTKTAPAGLFFGLGDGLLRDSTCKETFYPQILKGQYALQLAYPTVWDAQSIGRHPALWENFKNKPWTSDDFVFVLWRKRVFCAGAYDCKSTFSGF